MPRRQAHPVRSCITVGSGYIFPLYGPVLTRRMGLSMSSTNGLSLGLVLGQYASALVIGSLADRSCRLSSLLGSALFVVGYSSMAISLSRTSPPSFAFFIGWFLLVGAGTVSSYFAALTASAKSFPRYPGVFRSSLISERLAEERHLRQALPSASQARCSAHLLLFYRA